MAFEGTGGHTGQTHVCLLRLGGHSRASVLWLTTTPEVAQQEQQVINIHDSICAYVLGKVSRLSKLAQQREQIVHIDRAVARLPHT